ncbi:c-type cytochrome [Fulvivirga sp. 29W222]|uniref:C-type cytochrome n=1 Tax=Fulvivirga marina TaxID=2494733 RepID=A0A937FYN9_9BACT|nr:c-type cytochrome [Fulvivirga marina]MBL6448439.1 c-type cytochrome [Fulvivirga marina]
MEIWKILKLFTRITSVFVVLAAALLLVLAIYIIKPSVFNQRKNLTDKEWVLRNIETDLPEGKAGQLIKYGYLLVSESPKWMGPMVKDSSLVYTGNNLACKNCHLENGTQAGSASWIGVTNRYPQFRGRENKIGTIEERVNGCMERSMNGRKLPTDSKQMEAIVAYMEWLSDGLPEAKESQYKGFAKLKIPDVAADLVTGKATYIKECQVCHGEKGQGIKLADSTKGYLYPPLWGKDSYNHGAGMHRVLTAAQFIKGNMPFGQATWDNPKLTDEEAYHVAAYINSFERPLKQNTEADFPDLKLKPVSTPYPPWDDNFSAEQHKYGPYQPIIEFYKEKYGITKNK